MKPLSAGYVRKLIAGSLIQGRDETLIRHAAYRLKQVRHPDTLLFLKGKIVNWDRLEAFFPLTIVTDKVLRRYEDKKNVTIIKVEDLEEAYWKVINDYRQNIDIPVIAVTGTAGKTTTKEMIFHILSTNREIAHSISTNNSRTAHLTNLFSIGNTTETAVFETAVGAPGDLTKAAAYLKPTIGIITNIGEHHLNYCKTIEGYIAAKGELCHALGPDGKLLINCDDLYTKRLDLSKFKGKVITVGIHEPCNYRASDISFSSQGMHFTVLRNGKRHQVYVPGLGVHQVYNALFAIAAADAVNMDFETVKERLKTYEPLNKQLQVRDGLNDSILIDDTWSITTTSLEAALKVLNAVGETKKKIAIIGTITDLGSWGFIIHKHAGKIIADNKVDVLITVGEHASIMAEYVKRTNPVKEVYSFANQHGAFKLLNEIVDSHTIILIKGDMYSDAIAKLALLLRKQT
ncbi:Mur ligase family protein [Sporosarcina oncorhynchi]|uniref:Mur ligase family protein n=1 Tax=Sporosarcina oncorhynchi TaxID=3056444 RepID=A0ABZ0LBK7_9BACL|nr:Mur ligase family protein [Sporosarcina sp. T2O-4]WOV89029.1 Mur ligase family protein [Sporosarcina sp. T2O-4]